MPKVLIAFYSRTGNTARIADAIAEGAAQVRHTEVELRRLPDLAAPSVIEANERWRTSVADLAAKYRTLEEPEQLAEYDGIILGSPTRYGVMAAELKHLLDQTGPMWMEGRFINKVGGAFTSVSTPHGGHETTLWSIMTAMANLGMILAPPGYTDKVFFRAGSPYGATATTRPDGPSEDDLAAARHQGARIAKVSGWIRHALSHEH